MKKISRYEAEIALKEGKIVKDISNNIYYKMINGQVVYANTPGFLTTTISTTFENRYEIYELINDSKAQEIQHLKVLISKQMKAQDYIDAVEWAYSRIRQLEDENE